MRNINSDIDVNDYVENDMGFPGVVTGIIRDKDDGRITHVTVRFNALKWAERTIDIDTLNSKYLRIGRTGIPQGAIPNE